MIRDEQLSELKFYKNLEKQHRVCNRVEFASLVVAGSNEDLPVHRWFRFKESYSASLLQSLLGLASESDKSISILDPFCGVGTTLLSAQTDQSHRISAIGIEHNPFIRFVAITKLSWHRTNVDEFLRIGNRCLEAPPSNSDSLPDLSSIRTGRCISTYAARRLLGIRQAIEDDGNSATHKLLLLGLASAIEPLSRTRKDGRALRIVERDRQVISSVLRSRWYEMATDIDQMKKSVTRINRVAVNSGDGRNPLGNGIETDSMDFLVTSPPYPNHIDYSEVYKLELWLMGFISNQKRFLTLRKGTLRSHPTSFLGDADHIEREIEKSLLARVYEPIAEKLITHKEKWRRQLFLAYFTDLHRSLTQYFKILRKGGKAYITVGNSLHGGKDQPYLIATDLILAEIAKFVGFIVEEITIARSLKRRLIGNHFLRESVVVLRK
jgi:DNA modification methylase